MLETYDWFKVPASIHKVLANAHKVLANADELIINSPAPLGLMGEEAIESRHRVYKFDREHHTRKKTEKPTYMTFSFELYKLLISLFVQPHLQKD